jgi:hypothetical protein
MNARILAELGMEGCSQRFAVAHEHGIVPFRGNDLDFFADALDFRRADEDHFDGMIFELPFPDGAVELASIGVTADGDVERSQAGLRRIFYLRCEHDCTRAGPERRLGQHKLFELFEAGLAEKFQERARFASGNDEAVDLVQLLGLFDEDHLHAEFFEAAAVGVEIALQGQDADGRWRFLGRLRNPLRLLILFDV